MNTTYLLILLIVSILAIWGLFNLDGDYHKIAIPVAFIATPIAILLLIVSFAADFGTTKIVTYDKFLLEKTPYRIIISIDHSGGEDIVHKEFTDAQFVNNADKIKAITLEIPKNAWGIEITSEMKVRPIISD